MLALAFKAELEFWRNLIESQDNFSCKITDKLYSSSFEDLLTTIKGIYLYDKSIRSCKNSNVFPACLMA